MKSGSIRLVVLLLGLAFAVALSGSVATAQGADANKNVVIFVTDGLRHGSVTPEVAPTLHGIRENGVHFENSHSLFPTFTTANASAIATGHYLGDTGDFSNTIYSGFPVPSAEGSVTPFIEDDPILTDLNEEFSGNYLNEETLLSAARQAGYSTAAIGKLGPAYVQAAPGIGREDGEIKTPGTIVMDDSTGTEDGVALDAQTKQALKDAGLPQKTPERGENGEAGDFETPGAKVPNTIQQNYFTGAINKAILPLFEERDKPFVMVYWARDPDGTQHNQGDSFQTITPGINGETSKAAVSNTDSNISSVMQTLEKQGLADSTDVFVTSDHGFSTISRSVVDEGGATTDSYAATRSYDDVKEGFLPPGFPAIDLAHAFGEPLYDADDPRTELEDGEVAYKRVDPENGEHPENGNSLVGGNGVFKDGGTDAKVIFAANGGSDLVYLPNGDPGLARKVVSFLSSQDYVSGVFVDEERFGEVPGALSLEDINLEGSAATPTPSIVVNFTSFPTDPTDPEMSAVEIADTTLQQGQGMHGSFGRSDTYNNMAAIGPDFKSGYTDEAPASNADVIRTLASALDLDIPSNGDLQGRVLEEALAGGPSSVDYSAGSIESDVAEGGAKTIMNYQLVGETRYFDTAGFAGRTVGLTETPTTGGLDPLPLALAALMVAAGLTGVLFVIRRGSSARRTS